MAFVLLFVIVFYLITMVPLRQLVLAEGVGLTIGLGKYLLFVLILLGTGALTAVPAWRLNRRLLSVLVGMALLVGLNEVAKLDLARWLRPTGL